MGLTGRLVRTSLLFMKTTTNAAPMMPADMLQALDTLIANAPDAATREKREMVRAFFAGAESREVFASHVYEVVTARR